MSAQAQGGQREMKPHAVEVRPQVNFYSIELVTPARPFWESLARLVSRLGAAARQKGESRR